MIFHKNRSEMKLTSENRIYNMSFVITTKAYKISYKAIVFYWRKSV